MDTDRQEKQAIGLVEEELTEKILGAAFKVHNTLGSGFLEKVYENALAIELSRMGVPVGQQKPLKVKYGGVVVGDYHADLIADNRVVVECKAVSQLDPVFDAQLLNYLKATGIRVGFVLNFGRPKLQYRRLVL